MSEETTLPEDQETEAADVTNLETAETGSPNSSDSAPSEPTETSEFSAAEFESDYGLPAGSLKGATDADAALQMVRDYTDQTLVAALRTDGAHAAADTGGEPETPPAKKEGSGNLELDALRAELVEVRTHLQRQEEGRQQGLLQEIDRRASAEIDKWASPKYGVGAKRNFKQLQATRELRGLLATHIAGLQAVGQPVPQVEAVMRRVRAFHDEGFTPTKKGAAAAEALGSPGTRKADKGGDQPRNIHEALMRNRT